MLKGWADGAGTDLMLLNIKLIQCSGKIKLMSQTQMVSTVNHRIAQTDKLIYKLYMWHAFLLFYVFYYFNLYVLCT